MEYSFKKNLLVLTAMNLEMKAVKKHFTGAKSFLLHRKLNIKAKVINLNARKIILAQSGVGLVNVALTIGFISKKFKLDGILLLGVAGALKAHLRVGDVVLATKVIQHDSIYSGPEKTKLMAPGKLYVSLKSEERENPVFKVNPMLLRQFERLLSITNLKVYKGTIISGSEFVGNRKRKRHLATIDTQTLAVDMEAAGVAQVANKLGIPFVVIKTIADRFNPLQSITHDYKSFVSLAAENASKIVEMII